ncbi:MAG TPA: glycosyltransferase family 39 protein [Thermoleophilaceae bacterium]|nr:glycosyltransferase family 39 protein [Thermoleophilaceae bacterium]
MVRRLRITRREARLLALLLVLGFALRVAFVVATHGHQLLGDELEYDSEGRFIADGHWFWTLAPTGVPHAGMWKVPVYPAFVGVLYKVLGEHPDRVLLVQTLIGPVTIFLTWVLARRLFGTRAAFVAAALVAICPFAWQFEVRLLAESIVTPLTLLFMIVLVERPLTRRRVVLVGVVLGAIILTRPSAVYLVPVVAVAFVLAGGLRRGALSTAAALAVTVLVVAPWVVRNHSVSGAWVLSTQDVAPYGTFNDDSANDPETPYAWRIHNRRDARVLARARQLGELGLRNRLRHNTVEWIKDHPFSVVEAFYWNGLTRLWDVRRPHHPLNEARYSGRPRWFAAIGLATYWLALPFALFALWTLRRRVAVFLPFVVLALSASVVFSAEAETRYRAPFDPLVAVLAGFGAVTAWNSVRRRRGLPPLPPGEAHRARDSSAQADPATRVA